MIKSKKNYERLLKDLIKHKELINEDYDLRCLQSIKDKIFICELIEDFGWVIPSHIRGNSEWFRINDEMSAGTWGEGAPRSIGWEDTGRDPKGEFLLAIWFSTGAYFFGDEYDTNFFKQFFTELESYNPSYKDSRNGALYFSKKEAGVFLQNYPAVLKKYRELYKAEANKRKAKRLREELEKLEN